MRSRAPYLSLATRARAHRSLARAIALAVLASCAVAAWASAVELGAAPRADVSQETFGWDERTLAKAARTRADVVSLYRTAYLPGSAVGLSWTGALPACNPGSANVEHQQAVLDRVNYFRALAGLPTVVLLSAGEPSQQQAAALMFSANDALSHTPPASWLCYSGAGARGAGSSNIALGSNGVRSIDLYMDDFGSGNEPVGHRRWILYPPQAGIATGDIPGGNQPPRPANALYVLGAFGTRPATPNGIAWPPAGFVPYANLPAQSNRWSFSYPQANFSNATVALTGPAGSIPVALEMLANGYGDNTIVFKPAAFPYGRPTVDTTYTVTLGGIAGPGVPPTISYGVTIIDPDADSAPAATVDVVEYYNAALDHYFISWVPAEIANLDAGRTPTRWLRTGVTFKAYASLHAGTSSVCRFYIPPQQGDSHFFGRGSAECNATALAHPQFVLEEPSFMSMSLPVSGTCPPGAVPVYRVFSNRADANHRYMTDRTLRQQMVAAGWLAEGDGPDLVVMCAPD